MKKKHKINPEPASQLGIIRAAQAGDEPAMLALHERFDEYGCKLARRFMSSFSDDETLREVAGEVKLAVQETIDRYEEKRKVLFSTLFFLIVRRRIFELVRSHLRWRRHVVCVDPHNGVVGSGSLKQAVAGLDSVDGFACHGFMPAINDPMDTLRLDSLEGFDSADPSSRLEPTSASAEFMAAPGAADKLRRLVGALPDPAVRLALRARYFEGLSTTDIGALLGVTPGAAAKLYRSGVSQLREKIG